jgi:hypothetical protein
MEGLSMGAPTTSIFSEALIQHLEHTQIVNILAEYNVIAYHRYVDDILIVNNSDSTNIEDLLSKFNGLHPDMQFKIKMGTENRLNFLDIAIHRMQRKLQFGIWKPTATDILIHSQSCHPREHKWFGIAYLINRLRAYPIENKLEEKNTIEHLLIANGFHQNVIDILNRQKHGKSRKNPPRNLRRNG